MPILQLPCYEVDTVSCQYPDPVTRTFYDNQSSAVETRTPLDSTQDPLIAILLEKNG